MSLGLVCGVKKQKDPGKGPGPRVQRGWLLKYGTCRKDWKEKENMHLIRSGLWSKVPTSLNSHLRLHKPRPVSYYSPFLLPNIQSSDKGIGHEMLLTAGTPSYPSLRT